MGSTQRVIVTGTLVTAACALGYWLGRSSEPSRGAPESPGAASEDPAEVDDLAGRWREARRAAREAGEPLTHGGEDALEQSLLAGLGYADGTHEADDDRPVVPIFDVERAQPGLNFLTSGHGPEALLVDMQGRVLHRWRRSVADVWPDEFDDPASMGSENWTFFRRAQLFPNGDVLALFSGAGLVRLDAHSEVIWALRGRFHHEIALDPEGRIYALDRETKVLPTINRKLPLLEDWITVLSPGGEILQRVSLVECFLDSEYRGVLDFVPVGMDIFHTNSIKVLDGTLADRHPAFQAGNALISIRHTNTLAVVDLDASTVPWALSGNWRRQHDPTVLPGGNMLVLDNLPATDHSRAVEFDPFTQEVAWEFVGSEQVPLHTRTCGAARRLANGNTLLTESDYGRAIEITPDGEVVWEFISPFRAGDDADLVATLFEVMRLPADYLDEGVLPGR